MKKIIKYLLLNILISLLLIIFFVFIGFSLGYASSDKYLLNTWYLFGIFVFLHLFIHSVVQIILKKKFDLQIILGYGVIVTIWTLFALIGFC